MPADRRHTMLTRLSVGAGALAVLATGADHLQQYAANQFHLVFAVMGRACATPAGQRASTRAISARGVPPGSPCDGCLGWRRCFDSLDVRLSAVGADSAFVLLDCVVVDAGVASAH